MSRRSSPPPAVLRAIREGHPGGIVNAAPRRPVQRFLVEHGPFGAHHVALVDGCVRCQVLRS